MILRADGEALRATAELVDRRDEFDEPITAAVVSARRSERSSSEIGAMLGAAQRKKGPKTSVS